METRLEKTRTKRALGPKKATKVPAVKSGPKIQEALVALFVSISCKMVQFSQTDLRMKE